MNRKKPIILIVSSPSGGGKTTIVSRLLEKMEGIKRSVSCTTREPRDGEENNKDYIFITEEEFKKRIEKNAFLEWEENFGFYYGTPRAPIEDVLEKGEDVILSIDVKGAKRVKAKLPGSISVFIMPPSKEELTERLKKRRTEGESELNVRLKESEREIAAASEYDYTIINKDLDQATEELMEIIKKEREKRG